MNKKGFMTIYGLSIFHLVLLFTTVYTSILNYELSTINVNEDLHYVEMYSIQIVKQDLLKYEEADRTLSYLGYDIIINYEDITCYISIVKDGHVFLSSCLEWDDIDNVVVNYGYTD